jgi:glycosyltransferase involved in cell wall biosynthesis
MKQDDMNGRVFSFSDRNCPSQPTGGPAGVNYRLLLANKRFQSINNMYHIFSDIIVEKDAMLSVVLNSDGTEGDIERLTRYFKKLDEYYCFTDDDVYLFHDAIGAYAFLLTFKVTKTVLVYHQQGSLYREWQYFSGQSDKKAKKDMDTVLAYVLTKVKYAAFPSMGAKESLIASDSIFESFIDDAKVKVLYNGCDSPERVETNSEQVDSAIMAIQNSPDPIFITVAALNEAKGVERVPSFLADVKAKYGPINWIVVGDGVKANELDENIKRYGLEENVIWIKDRVAHDNILALFMYSDFYILAHRYSIFDFSTIEAMNYGNIPVLTPVGGNKEMIIEDNGIFMNDLSTCKDFDDFISTHKLVEVKEKNVEIARKIFSEEAFLNGYFELVKELLQQKS